MNNTVPLGPPHQGWSPLKLAIAADWPLPACLRGLQAPFKPGGIRGGAKGGMSEVIVAKPANRLMPRGNIRS